MLKSVKVRDYMAASLVVLSPEMEVLDAIHLFIQVPALPKQRTVSDTMNGK